MATLVKDQNGNWVSSNVGNSLSVNDLLGPDTSAGGNLGSTGSGAIDPITRQPLDLTNRPQQTDYSQLSMMPVGNIGTLGNPNPPATPGISSSQVQVPMPLLNNPMGSISMQPAYSLQGSPAYRPPVAPAAPVQAPQKPTVPIVPPANIAGQNPLRMAMEPNDTFNQGTPPTNLAPGNDPYSRFSTMLMSALKSAQQPIGAARDELTNQSLNLSNPLNSTPYSELYKNTTPEASLGIQQGTQNAFEPGITSLNTMLQLSNNAVGNFNNTLGQINDLTKPMFDANGNMLDRNGNVLHAGARYPTMFINPMTGLPDSMDINTGKLASEEHGNPAMQSTPMNNPYTLMQAIAKQEGGKYDTINPDSGALGKYQIMPLHLPEFGLPNSQQGIQQFLANPQLQDKAFSQLFTGLWNKYQDPSKVAAAYYGGDGAISKLGTLAGDIPQGKYTSINGYVKSVLNMAGQGQGNQSQNQSQGVQGFTSPIGGQFSPEAAQKLQQLPQWMQNFADAGPKGVAYINADKMPNDPTTVSAVKRFAANAGVPIAEAGDTQALKSIGVVYAQLNQINSLIDTPSGGSNGALGSGVLGRIMGLTTNQAAEGLQTPHGINLGMIDNFRQTAIKDIQALAGGAGSGLKINGSEIMAAAEALPTSKDNYETAKRKLALASSMLDKQLAASFPYVSGGTGQSGASGYTGNNQAGGQTGMTPSGISYTIH